MAKVMIEIPSEFNNDLVDRFSEFFGRVCADMTGDDGSVKLCGNYEFETAKMLATAFKNCVVMPMENDE